MNIQMMTDEALEKCRAEVEELTRKIYAHPDDGSWISAFTGKDPFETKKYEIDDISLQIPTKGSPDEDDVKAANAIAIHKALKDLPGYIIGDIRFWAWFTFTIGYKYAQYKSEITQDYIKNWWVPKGDNTRRSVMLQVLGREYFIADLSYQLKEDGTPDYYYTKYLSSSMELYRNLVFRNISDIPAVSKALIMGCADFERTSGKAITPDTIRPLLKGVSNLGSVRLIDSIPEEKLYEWVKKKLSSLIGKQ